MVRPKKNSVRPQAKRVALLASIVVLLMSLVYVPDWSLVGVAQGSPLTARLVYPLFHASPLHALLNVWCLLSMVFIYDLSIPILLAAYIVAISVPGPLLSEVPTVGLSCVCWCLLGSLIFYVRRKLCFFAYMALYMAVGFLFPSVNALIHIYGYVAGLLVGALNSPIPCSFKKIMTKTK